MLSSMDSSNLQFFSPTTYRTMPLNKMNRSVSPASRNSNSSQNSSDSVVFEDDKVLTTSEFISNESINSSVALSKSLNMPYIPDQVFIGGRKSKLAVAQSRIIRQLIKEKFPMISLPILALTTLGDQVQNKPLYSFGGKSLWTKELEILLLQDLGDYDQLDLIVHSLKDMPTNLPEEFELGCIVKREDPSDAVLMEINSPYKSLKDLPKGSVVGTSSVRRSAQLKKNFPNLIFQSIRGNLQTRIQKLDDPNTEFKCIILATAGLTRLDLDYRITERLDSSIMYHAVGQGALGIEIRSNDSIMKAILKTIEDKNATICCLAERALLRTLEGGCSVPIGVQSFYNESTKELNLKSIVISVDGQKFVEDEITSIVDIDSNDYKLQADKVGEELAIRLKNLGAKEILDEINFDKINEKNE